MTPFRCQLTRLGSQVVTAAVECSPLQHPYRTSFVYVYVPTGTCWCALISYRLRVGPAVGQAAVGGRGLHRLYVVPDLVSSPDPPPGNETIPDSEIGQAHVRSNLLTQRPCLN